MIPQTIPPELLCAMAHLIMGLVNKSGTVPVPHASFLS